MIWKMAVPALVLAAAVACTPVPSQFRRGQLNIRKDCSMFAGRAGDTCTITSSNLADLPAGTVITYASAAVGTSLDTDVSLAPPGGAAKASGHCTISLATGTGQCRLSGGTGAFTSFRAAVNVSPLTAPNFAWDGTYSFGL